MTVRAKAGAGIEELIFTVDVDDGDGVVELGKAGKGFGEDAAIATGNAAEVGLESGGSGQRDKDASDLVVGAALAGPDVVGCAHLLEALGFFLGAGVLTGKPSVFELHDSRVEFSQLLIGR